MKNWKAISIFIFPALILTFFLFTAEKTDYDCKIIEKTADISDGQTNLGWTYNEHGHTISVPDISPSPINIKTKNSQRIFNYLFQANLKIEHRLHYYMVYAESISTLDGLSKFQRFNI